jgi:hypothetical protein
MEEHDHFTFPAHMPRQDAARILADSYADVNAGKVVRRTTRRARGAGYEPPFDVAYVAEPAVADFEDGLGVSLGADILLYDEFKGWQQCLRIFEEEVGDALMAKVEKRVRKWIRRNPAPKG